MREEKKLSKFTLLIILLTIVALILVSGTYARYTTAINASDIATVAKWSILVEGTEMAVTGTQPTVAFNLFDTIYEEDGTTAEADVAAGKIAPGTGGSFALDIVNASEVNAEYSLTYTVENDLSIPLEFSTDGGTNWGTLANTTATAIAMSDGAAGGADEKTITIQWRWAYGADAANELTDTAIGIAAREGTAEVEVTATINVTQVN